MLEVKIIKSTKDGVAGKRKFEDAKAATRFKNAVKLRNGFLRNGNIADAKCNGENVGAVISKRQGHRVTNVISQFVRE